MKRLFIVLLSVLLIMGFASMGFADPEAGINECPCNISPWALNAWEATYLEEGGEDSETVAFETTGTNTFGYLIRNTWNDTYDNMIVIVAKGDGSNGNWCALQINEDVLNAHEITYDQVIYNLSPAQCDACRLLLINSKPYINNIE